MARMRLSMAELTPRFSSNRMLREYVEKSYLPVAQAHRDRTTDGARKSALLCQWRRSLNENWRQLHFGSLEVQEKDEHYAFIVPVYPGDVDPGAIQVQLYAVAQSGRESEVYPMSQGDEILHLERGYLYSTQIPIGRPAGDYTPRIIPAFEGASVPIEVNQILWYR